MDINEITRLLQPLVAPDLAKKCLELPLRLCPEPVQVAIPSYALQKDGTALRAVFLIMKHFICEVRISQSEQHFDFAHLSTVLNYRIRLWEHKIDIVKGDPKVAQTTKETITFQVATVELSHIYHGETEINYVGDNREAWVAELTKYLPVSIVSTGVGHAGSYP